MQSELTTSGKEGISPSPSTDHLLQIAFHGDDEQWLDLCEKCHDRNWAEGFARALAAAPPAHLEQANHWLETIREIHPDL